MKRLMVAALYYSIMTGCGVEVGNPGGDEPDKGTLNIFFAREPVVEAESLSLSLASIDLVSTDSQDTVASLSPEVSDVDIFGLTESDQIKVAESTDIPTGIYGQVVIQLNQESPFKYRDRDGEEKPVRFEEQSQRAFYVQQDFEIITGETTTLVLSLDPYNSLAKTDENGFIFRPRGDFRPKRHFIKHSGETDFENAEWVCAYAYAVEEIPKPPRWEGDPNATLPPPPGPPPGHPGPGVIDRITFATKEDVVKDATSLCANAFTKAPVVEGKYEIRNLRPATYTLRFFDESGGFQDGIEEVVISKDDFKPEVDPKLIRGR